MTTPNASHFSGLSGFARAVVQVGDTEDAALFAMMASSLEGSDVCYPVLRFHRAALRCSHGSVFDRMGARTEWKAWAVHPTTLLLRATDAFASFRVTGDDLSCTVSIRIWAKDALAAALFEAAFHEEVAPHRVASEVMFSLNWCFMSAHGLKKVLTIERVQDELLDEAYPTLHGGVQSFISQFLDSPAAVLVLQGPPGMGKTRLVRAILKEMSRRKPGDGHADALYSGDKSVWQSDEIFMQYLTGEHDAFLIEDADHLLQARSDGNQVLHRFLNISDGVVQAQGRKIVFSTNLVNVGDIDEALVRPGRCFAHVVLRSLQWAEAKRLLARLCGEDSARLDRAQYRMERIGARSWSVAKVYEAWQNAVTTDDGDKATGANLRLVGE